MAAMTKSKDALCIKHAYLTIATTTADAQRALTGIATEDTIVSAMRYATASTAAPINDTDTFSIPAAGYVANSDTMAVGDRVEILWLDNSA